MSVPVSSGINLLVATLALSATAGLGAYYLGNKGFDLAPEPVPPVAETAEAPADEDADVDVGPLMTENEPVFIVHATQDGTDARWFGLPNMFKTVTHTSDDGEIVMVHGGFFVIFETAGELDFSRVEYAIPLADCIASAATAEAGLRVFENIDEGEWEFKGNAWSGEENPRVADILAKTVCEVHFARAATP